MQALSARLTSKRLYIADLAARIGMTRQTIAAVEAGKYSPSLEAAFRISRVFDCGVEDVFQWQG